jgi:hypothetical protein
MVSYRPDDSILCIFYKELAKRDFQLHDRHSFAIKKAVLNLNGEKGGSKMANKTYLDTILVSSDKTESYRKVRPIPLYGGITQNKRGIKSLFLSAVVLTLLASFYATAAPTITIRPYEHKHTFWITGATHDWYPTSL